MLNRRIAWACMAVLWPICGDMAAAQTAPWYVGASAGRTAGKIDDAVIVDGLAAAGIASGTIDHDDRGTGIKLYGGLRVLPYLSIEGGYQDLGHLSFDAGSAAASGSFGGRLRLDGLNLDLLATLPLGHSVSVIGRLGVTDTRGRATYTQTGAAVALFDASARTKQSVGLDTGVGLEFAATPALGLRLEAQGWRFDDPVGRRESLRLISLGIVYRFGAGLSSVGR